MIRQTRSRVHIHRIEEEFRSGNPGYWAHPGWETRFPWLAQGTTGRVEGEGEDLPGFGLFTDPPAPKAFESWEELGHQLDFPRIVHSRQIHGGGVRIHEEQVPTHPAPPGPRLVLSPDCDGHITAERGLLLGVAVADCVPVFVVDPVERVAALLHAGWRGIVAGILRTGIDLLEKEFGSSPGDLFLHLGPAICGKCYQVGGEVHRALGLPDPSGPEPVDLRAYLAARAVSLGVGKDRVTESSWCTLCGGSPFFSHRRGDPGRQVGFLGVKAR